MRCTASIRVRWGGIWGFALTATAACGGGTSGSGSAAFDDNDTLVLLRVSSANQDNVPINRVVTFSFTTSVDPATVSPSSIQVREGEAFGETAKGRFEVAGATVRFLPDIPRECDFSDAGFRPATTYRITVVGYPEEFCVRSTGGKPLDRTSTHEFETLPEDDPAFLEDTNPLPPNVLSTSPADGSQAVEVALGNRITVDFSEPLAPCSVDSTNVILWMTQVGDPAVFLPAANGRSSGFSPATDQDPGDPFRWGAANSTDVSPAQRIPIEVFLDQDYGETRMVVVPQGGAAFPDNALLVLELLAGIQDFGGNLVQPITVAFTTENLPPHEGTYVLEFAGETPIEETATTADVNTKRAPGRAQGFVTFPGDGDNGADLLTPSGPGPCYFQSNDGTPDDFNPGSNVTLRSGTVLNTCPNLVDGSTAVVFEYRSFRIRAGVTVTIDGVNPVIILVKNGAVIEAGGSLVLRGENGQGWKWAGQGAAAPVTALGGKGFAGGGTGGSSIWGNTNWGQDGFDGFGSPDSLLKGGVGSGKGGVAIVKTVITNGGTGGGGGGGGHGTFGGEGGIEASAVATFKSSHHSQGGAEYLSTNDGVRMSRPSAGAGGGGGGYLEATWTGNIAGNALSGGGGGGGGGFVDITSPNDIVVGGTIDARGGNGGNNVGLWNGANYLCNSGSGGGGAGGGIRLLSGNHVDVLATAVLTTAGGAGGGTDSAATTAPDNRGGIGASGRIVLEDADGVMPSSASFVPSTDKSGHWRAPLDVSRFPGSLAAQALTKPFWVGSLGPTLLVPTQQAAVATDFVAGIPAGSGRGLGQTSILVEARGFPILVSGHPDLANATPWRTVGVLSESGTPDDPVFVTATPGDVVVPSDNAGGAFTDLNGVVPSAFLQVRVTFYLAPGMGFADFGPLLDRWVIRFTHDQ